MCTIFEHLATSSEIARDNKVIFEQKEETLMTMMRCFVDLGREREIVESKLATYQRHSALLEQKCATLEGINAELKKNRDFWKESSVTITSDQRKIQRVLQMRIEELEERIDNLMQGSSKQAHGITMKEPANGIEKQNRYLLMHGLETETEKMNDREADAKEDVGKRGNDHWEVVPANAACANSANDSE